MQSELGDGKFSPVASEQVHNRGAFTDVLIVRQSLSAVSGRRTVSQVAEGHPRLEGAAQYSEPLHRVALFCATKLRFCFAHTLNRSRQMVGPRFRRSRSRKCDLPAKTKEQVSLA